MGIGILVSPLVGLIAGWLAGQVMKGGGYGVLSTLFSAWSVASLAAGSSGSWASGRAAGFSARFSSRSWVQ